MSNVHVVGDELSFTWLATIERYGNRNRLVSGYGQQGLLEKLSITKKTRISEAVIAPIWNSNYGTIKFSSTGEDLTAGALKGEAGRIVDLWGKRISFFCGLHGIKIALDGNVYSVKVAKYQCSDFFETHSKANFINDGYDTTTIAFREFDKNKKLGDRLLCSIELLKQHKINIIKGDVANPFNYTVFFGFNTYAGVNKHLPKISLGCFQMVLEGTTELPVDFSAYWKDITRTKEILRSSRVLDVMPKINFILRYEKSKALVLAEMPSREDLKNPWPNVSGDSDIESLGQVGLLKDSFTEETCGLIREFKLKGRKVIFYGRPEKNTFFWICPSLKLSIHGFEPELVKNCAKLQVMQLKNLQRDGIVFPEKARLILNGFDKNAGALKLAADSKPDNG